MSNKNYQLVVRRGPQEGQVFPLSGDMIVVGRDPMSDVTLVDPEVSRQHARLTRTADGGYELQDLGSTNGSFVDGIRLGGDKVRLASGQIVVLGSNVTLVFEALPEQTATVIASREELGLDDVTADEPPGFDEAPPVEDIAATERLVDERPPDYDATIIDQSFDQPAYPVFSAQEPEPAPMPSFEAEPEPLPSFDDSWSTPADSGGEMGMPVYEPQSTSNPPPPPPAGGGASGEGNNRNMILIAVVVVILLCCCCALLAGGYQYGDLLLDALNF